MVKNLTNGTAQDAKTLTVVKNESATDTKTVIPIERRELQTVIGKVVAIGQKIKQRNNTLIYIERLNRFVINAEKEDYGQEFSISDGNRKSEFSVADPEMLVKILDTLKMEFGKRIAKLETEIESATI